jgi:hypothetical protein
VLADRTNLSLGTSVPVCSDLMPNIDYIDPPKFASDAELCFSVRKKGMLLKNFPLSIVAKYLIHLHPLAPPLVMLRVY